MAKIVGIMKGILGLDKSKYEKGLKSAEKKTNKFGKAIKRVGGMLAGAFAVNKIAGMIGKTATLADSLGKLSKQTGFSVETLQKYQFAAERSGVSSDKLNTSLQVFQKRLGELHADTGSLYTRLKKMDPAFMAQLKAADSADEAFKIYADRMKNASSETEQAALAQAGFSRAGLDMTRMMRDGSAGIAELGRQAKETGGILSADLVKAAEDYKDQQTNMNMAFRGLKGILLKELMPAIKTWMDRIKNAAKWIKENQGAILSWIKTVGKVVGVFAAARVAVMAFNAVLAANPIGLVITLISTLVAAIASAWKESAKFRAKVKYLWESIKYYFGLAKDFVVQVAKSKWNAFKAYFSAIGDLAKTTWNAIKAAFQKGKSPGEVFRDGLKKVKQDLVDVGKESAEGFKEIFEDKSKPDYQKILNAEQAGKQAKKAGEKAGEEYTKAMKKGMAEGGGAKMKTPEKDTGVAFTGLPKESVDTTLAGMEKIKRGNKEMRDELKKSQEQGTLLGGIMSRAFEGMSNSISDALKEGENVLQSFWKFFKNWVQSLVIKLLSAAAAAAVLAAVMMMIPGMGVGGGVSGSFGGEFMKAIKQFSSFGVGMAEGGIVPPGYPSDTYPARLTSGEVVAQPKDLKGLEGAGRKGYIAETRIHLDELRIGIKEQERKHENTV